LEPMGPGIAERLGGAALALTWRMVHPRQAEPYVTGPAWLAPTRLYYEAQDGWRAPLFFLPACPGGRGEPVLLVHGLGGTWRDFAVEPARCLAQALTDAGFAVYLLAHRGDRSAIAPADARPFSADDIAVHDVDAALDAVRAHSGFDRVCWVGHGLGAQLLYLRLSLVGDDAIAAAVTLNGAVRFEVTASAARAAGRVAQLLPAGWVLPGRRAQQLVSPFVGGGERIGSPDTEGPVARARLRHAAGDLHGGVVRQVARWVATGHLTDATGRIDVVEALRPFPTLVVEPDADPACPPGAAEPVVAPLAAAFRKLEGGWGHLDPLTGQRAPRDLHPHLLRFLAARRERCW
jgi:predicted alpha/beta hydrolase